jgi:hypothetical protein
MGVNFMEFVYFVAKTEDGVREMSNLIGGLFETQEDANLVYAALQKAGFTSEQIKVFVHKPRARTARKMDVQGSDIARHAVFGALLIGAVGALIGLLVGAGILPLPGLEPGLVQLNGLFLVTSILWGLMAGGLTGIILGVAWKLLGSREKAEVTTRQIEKRGVLVTVSADGAQSEGKARRVMEENHAIELGNPAEKWNLDGWSGSNDNDPSLKKLANTR